jgi:dolichol kinase
MQHMLTALLATVIIFCLLVVAEYLYRRKKLKGENSRKFIHIIIGTFIAFLPFWMGYEWVVLLSLGFVASSIINHYTHIFRAGYAVKRKSWGEIFFALAVLICAALRPSPWIFMAAILHVSLADGLAAVVGKWLGEHHGVHYKVFRHHKTAIGTATFMVVSFLILAVTVIGDPGFRIGTSIWPALVWLPVITTATENVGVYGLDNFLLPLVVVAALMPLHL